MDKDFTYFKNKAVEALELHYKKVDIHDEFENKETEAYLKAITNAIRLIKEINIEKQESMVQTDEFADLRLTCNACGHKEESVKRFSFSFNKRLKKRQVTQHEHCKKCDYEMRYSFICFDDDEREEEYKNLLEKCGQKWIEK